MTLQAVLLWQLKWKARIRIQDGAFLFGSRELSCIDLWKAYLKLYRHRGRARRPQGGRGFLLLRQPGRRVAAWRRRGTLHRLQVSLA